jgi:4-hydroxy-tetrahydrodipicolinate reductase
MALIYRRETMKVLINGCNGKMGQVLSRLVAETVDIEVSCGVDSIPDRIKNTYPVYASLAEVRETIDVIIDFSNHSSTEVLINFCIANKLPLVICTTGHTPEEMELILNASKLIPVFKSANMSLGVNLIISLAKQAAKTLYEDFDIEIIEKHHNQKLDSPSGTALMIADSINDALDKEYSYTYGRHSKLQKREKKEIGIHAIRGGSIVGEHQVIFASGGEVIEVNHSALSRDVFGYGALRASKLIYDKQNGLYNMDDILKK